MSEKENTQWITVNGAHIPIYDGQSREAAVISFMKDNEIPSKKKETATVQSKKPNLSKREYAVWYKKVGEIEAGGYVQKTKDGTKCIPLSTEENGKMTHKIVLTGGSYSSPKIKKVFEFENEEELIDFLNKLEEKK